MPNPFEPPPGFRRETNYFRLPRTEALEKLKEAQKAMVEGGIISIYGPPGIGKSELVRQWSEQSPENVWVVVEFEDFFDLDAGISSYHYAYRYDYRLWAALEKHFDDLKDEEPRQQAPYYRGEGIRFQGAVTRVLSASSQRVMLVLDGFHHAVAALNSGLVDGEAFDYFFWPYDYVKRQPESRFVVVDWHPLEQRLQLDGIWQQLKDKLQPVRSVEVEPFSRQEVRRYMQADGRVPWLRYALTKMYRQTRGHPYFTNLLAWHGVKQAEDNGRIRAVVLPDVELIESHIRSFGQEYADYLDLDDLNNEQRRVLREVIRRLDRSDEQPDVNRNRILPPLPTARPVSDILDELCAKGVLVCSGDRVGLTIPLLADFLYSRLEA